MPNANTRVEGTLSGQYHFADLLPVESYARLESAANVKPVLTAPFGFPYLVLNTKQGPLANVALRQAVQAALNNADMLGAGFGDPKFYSADANHYAKNTPFYSTAGTENYGKGDAKAAASGRRRQVRRHADQDPHQPAIRLPLPDGAGDGRKSQGRRDSRSTCRWSTGRR